MVFRETLVSRENKKRLIFALDLFFFSFSPFRPAAQRAAGRKGASPSHFSKPCTLFILLYTLHLFQAHVTTFSFRNTLPLALFIPANVRVPVAAGTRWAELDMFNNLLLVAGFARVQAAIGAKECGKRVANGLVNRCVGGIAFSQRDSAGKMQKQKRHDKKQFCLFQALNSSTYFVLLKQVWFITTLFL